MKFIVLYVAGIGAASGQDRLDSLLGKGGAGVQLYLQAEMRRGLQWQYGLVIAGCDARNMPVKVGHSMHLCIPALLPASRQGLH